mgnify:FL=1|jgi:hypothetical protein
MGVERKIRMSLRLSLKLLWMFVGVLVIGGIYFLSYYDVDETVVSESKTFFEFVRTVLQ